EDFINYLIWWLGNANILLIILYRPEYSHYWGSKSYYTKVGLNRLGAESSIELVKAMLEDADIAPELRDLILNRSEGNPLFMEEFTQTLLENGSIKKQEDHYILSRKISSIQVPDTIQGIIASRIDRLEDNLKRTMQVASVVGREFTFRILQTITGLKKELKSFLLNLQGLEFIYEKQLFPELEYIFKHALIQEVAYNSLPQKRQGEIHEKIGEAIEEIYVKQLPEFYEMLSYHYSKGKNYEKGAKYSELAASKGFRNGSFLDAIAFGEKRVWCLERLPQKEDIQQEMIDARTSLARFYIMLNYHTKAKEIIDPGNH
ncbi:MAG: guanylate cyclase, partial [Deltaproteobacteria bacterium]|nr:guanylate cyclase [Deltaproteobacteria bacterium]